MFKTFITVVKPYVEYSLQANKANTAKFYLYGHQNDQWLKVFYVTARQNNYYWGTRDDAEVRTLASYQCGLGSNPGVHTRCGLSLFWFSPLLREVFYRYSSPQKPIFKFQFNQESGRRRTTLWMCYLQIIFFKKINFMRKVKSIKQNKTFILILGF